MNRFYFILFIYSIIQCSSSLAQKKSISRLEFKSEQEYFNFMSFPLDEERIILAFGKRSERKKWIEWLFYQLDTNLNKVDSFQVEIQRRNTQRYLYLSNDFLYFFERNPKNGDYKIHTINLLNRANHSIEGHINSKYSVNEFAVLGGLAYIPLYSRKTRNFIHRVDTRSGSTDKVLVEVLAKDELEFEDIHEVSTDNTEVLWFNYKNCDRFECKHVLFTFSEGEERDSHFNIDRNGEHKIISFSPVNVNNTENWLSGTFSTDKVRDSHADGVFVQKQVMGKTEFSTFTRFLDMENSLNYLSEKRKTRIQSRKIRKAKKGKSYDLDYFMVTHDLIRQGDDFIVLGEAYYPTYRTESYSQRGRDFSRTVFDGYQYSHAIVAAYSKEGVLQWDQSFEMWLSEKTFRVKKFISPCVDGDTLKLLYLNDGVIKHLAISNGKIVKEESKQSVKTGKKGDSLKESNQEDMFHWYDDHFILFGHQRIKNKDETLLKRNREVYFLNKYTY